MARKFALKIIDETHPSSDKREFEPNTVGWRPLPLTLMGLRRNEPEGGHYKSVVIGAITDIWRQDGAVFGLGEFIEDDPHSAEYLNLIESGGLQGVSADIVGSDVRVVDYGNGDVRQRYFGGEIAAVTVLPIPAFPDTRIVVTAAAAPTEPPAAWFEKPSDPNIEPYALTVDPDGRVHGFAAKFGTCHIGRPGCRTAPLSNCNYKFFRIGATRTQEGTIVPTGAITLGTGHASISLNARAAAEHYDHTGAAVADVAVYDLPQGIFFTGALRPGVSPERVREFSGSGVSGDWRTIGGNLEMVGLLAVNTPGFPVARSEYALVAAGALFGDDAECDCGGECVDCADVLKETLMTISDNADVRNSAIYTSSTTWGFVPFAPAPSDHTAPNIYTTINKDYSQEIADLTALVTELKEALASVRAELTVFKAQHTVQLGMKTRKNPR